MIDLSRDYIPSFVPEQSGAPRGLKSLTERIGLNCCKKSTAGDDQWEKRKEALRIFPGYFHRLLPNHVRSRLGLVR